MSADDRRCVVCGGSTRETRTRDDGSTYVVGGIDTNWWRADLEAWNPSRVLVCSQPSCRAALTANDREYKRWLRARREARRATQRTAPALVDAGGWAAWGSMYSAMARSRKAGQR